MQTRAREVALLLYDEVDLLDVAGPLAVLSTVGRAWNWRPFKVSTVALRPGPVVTRHQLVIEAARALDALPAPELIIVPGGYGARRALAEPALISWLSRAGGGAEHVLAVGAGVLLLAHAGLLEDDAEVALPRALTAELAELAPRVTALPDAAPRTSGRVSTTATGASSIDATLEMIARLLGAKLALGAARELGAGWHPASGAPPGLSLAGEPGPIAIHEARGPRDE
ncbi:MAG: DJ-1/PfpI family protein [Polyangiaceae bacterium]|nr:DJ-1/PfpI family protein [Polyangiaceae bacterium]